MVIGVVKNLELFTDRLVDVAQKDCDSEEHIQYCLVSAGHGDSNRTRQVVQALGLHD